MLKIPKWSITLAQSIQQHIHWDHTCMIHIEVHHLYAPNKGSRFLQIKKHKSRTYPFGVALKFQQVPNPWHYFIYLPITCQIDVKKSWQSHFKIIFHKTLSLHSKAFNGHNKNIEKGHTTSMDGFNIMLPPINIYHQSNTLTRIGNHIS